jgi:hypothetical protein
MQKMKEAEHLSLILIFWRFVYLIGGLNYEEVLITWGGFAFGGEFLQSTFGELYAVRIYKLSIKKLRTHLTEKRFQVD